MKLPFPVVTQHQPWRALAPESVGHILEEVAYE